MNSQCFDLKIGYISKLRQETANKVLKLKSLITPDKISFPLETLISKLFDLGGIISGGAALSLLNNKPIRDIDFYFNNDNSYVEAANLVGFNRKIDVCWYFNNPMELHDISYVMCTLNRNGVYITEAAQEAFDTGISELYLNHIIYPNRTAQRMLKYNDRYNCKFKLAQVLAFISIFNIERQIANKLLTISI